MLSTMKRLLETNENPPGSGFIGHNPQSNHDAAYPSIPVISPIREACRVLGIVRVNGVSLVTVKQWRNGIRNAPRWFVRLLMDELEAREKRLRDLRETLAQYRGGPGIGHGLREYWRDRKSREIAEQVQRERDRSRSL